MLPSTWIESVRYIPANPHTGFLAVFTKAGPALLYAGVPSQRCGLVCAGTGRRSPGLAYNRLIRGRYPYQRIDDPARIAELRDLCNLKGQNS